MRGTRAATVEQRALATLPGPGGQPLVATGEIDGTVNLWRPLTEDGAFSGERVLDQYGETLTGHAGTVCGLATVPHPSGTTLLASAAEDGTVRLWKPEVDNVGLTGQASEDIVPGDAVAVTAMAMLPWPGEDPLLATASLDQGLRLWRPRSGLLVGSPDTALAAQPGLATWLAGAMAVATAELPDGDIRVAMGSGHIVGICRRGEATLTATYTSVCRMLWRRKKKKGEKLADSVVSNRVSKFSPIVAMATLAVPKGQTLLAVAGGRRIQFWDFATGRRRRGAVECAARVRCVVAMPLDDRILLAWGGDDGTVRLCDPVSRAAVGETLDGEHGSVLALARVPTLDGMRLAAGAADGSITVWDPVAGSAVAVMPEAHRGSVRALTAVPGTDRTLLASGGDDGELRVFDLADGETTFSLPVDVPVSSLLYWDGGIFVGSHSGLIRVGLPRPPV